jgi:hypothetical protein
VQKIKIFGFVLQSINGVPDRFVGIKKIGIFKFGAEFYLGMS